MSPDPQNLLTLYVTNTKEQRHLLESAIEGDEKALAAFKAVVDGAITPENLKALTRHVLNYS